MTTQKTIKFFAKFELLDWKSEIVEHILEGTHVCEGLTNKMLMKALNDGNLDELPSPFGGDSYWDIWRKVFNDGYNMWYSGQTKYIESEVLFGMIKFVVSENESVIMKWRYVEKNKEGENNA
jgi:hypothetical protein